MKKSIFLFVIIIFGLLLFGCTSTSIDSVPSEIESTATFAEFVEMYSNKDFKAAYISRSILPDENIDSQLDVYVIGDEFRMDRTNDDPTKNTSHIFRKTAAIACSNLTNNMVCYTGAPYIHKYELWGVTLLAVPTTDIISKHSEVVASENTTCFVLDYMANTNTVCFTNDGIIAKVRNIRKPDYFGSSYETIATSISRTVFETDFNPPATPQEPPWA